MESSRLGKTAGVWTKSLQQSCYAASISTPRIYT